MFYGKNKFVWSMIHEGKFLVLVPKNRNADDLKDYMPISLAGGLNANQGMTSKDVVKVQ